MASTTVRMAARAVLRCASSQRAIDRLGMEASSAQSRSGEAERGVEQRVLGRTGLRVSALGLGAAGIGGLYRTFADDEAAAAVVRRALDLGVTYVDTAPLYGRGASERRIGLALKDHPARVRCVVATKIGYVPEDFDYSFDATVRSVEASLRRLGLS